MASVDIRLMLFLSKLIQNKCFSSPTTRSTIKMCGHSALCLGRHFFRPHKIRHKNKILQLVLRKEIPPFHSVIWSWLSHGWVADESWYGQLFSASSWFPEALWRQPNSANHANGRLVSPDCGTIARFEFEQRTVAQSNGFPLFDTHTAVDRLYLSCIDACRLRQSRAVRCHSHFAILPPPGLRTAGDPAICGILCVCVPSNSGKLNLTL